MMLGWHPLIYAWFSMHPWNPYLTDKAISMLVFAHTIWLFWIFGRVEVTE